MEGLKMSHRSNPPSLPSIQGEPKVAEYGQADQKSYQARLSARSSIYSSAAYTTASISNKIDNLMPNIDIDEAIDLGRIRIEKRSHKQLLPPSVRNMAPSMRTKSGISVAQSLVAGTFDPMPYQPQYFKSSTLLKMVPVPKRHQDMFVEKTPMVPREKPLIIHSERYQYSEPFRPGYDRLSQRERLIAEREYMRRLKRQKLVRETLPHREPRDLLMGAHKARFSERFDVKDELRRLKAIVLPVNARELYHGKGIQLPSNHSSIKPRHRMPPPLPVVSSPEPEEELVKEAALYRHNKMSLDGLASKKTYKKPRQVKAKVDTHNENNLVRSQNMLPVERSLSRRSTDSNLTALILPEDDVFPDLPLSPALDSEADYTRNASRETMQPSTLPIRAESEMDIILQKDGESSPVKSTKPMTPLKAPTPNPLKAADLTLYHISEEELKVVFDKLDTDCDGHLMYPQVEPQFPTTINQAQKKYLKQIYDITSASTFFGVQEFVTMKCLMEEIANLDHELVIQGYEKINFQTLTTTIIRYTELFQQVDRLFKGKITLASLEDILCSALQRDKTQLEYGIKQLKTVLKLDSDEINKVKFIAGIPYFISLPHVKDPEELESDEIKKEETS